MVSPWFKCIALAAAFHVGGGKRREAWYCTWDGDRLFELEQYSEDTMHVARLQAHEPGGAGSRTTFLPGWITTPFIRDGVLCVTRRDGPEGVNQLWRSEDLEVWEQVAEFVAQDAEPRLIALAPLQGSTC
jgi:hypothetical protein